MRKRNKQMKAEIGRRVLIRTDKGMLYGGILRGRTRGGEWLMSVDETCLSGDLERGRIVIHKPELRAVAGVIVDDPRDKPAKDEPAYWSRLSLEDINRDG